MAYVPTKPKSTGASGKYKTYGASGSQTEAKVYEDTITINPKYIVSGGGQVAIKGDGSESDRYIQTTTTSTPTAQTTTPTPQPVSTVAPGVKEIFTGQQVQISQKLAEKINQQSLSDNQIYYVNVIKTKREAKPVTTNPYYKEQVKKSFIPEAKNEIILDPLERSKQLRKETAELWASDVSRVDKFVGTVWGGTGLLVGIPLAAAKQLTFDQVKFEGGEVFVSPELLIGGGTAITTFKPGQVRSIKTEVSTAEKQKFSKEYKSFLKREGITKNEVVTQEDALKIQEFMLKYNRENQATQLRARADTRLTKIPRTKEGQASRDLSVELKLKPVDRVELYGKLENLGGVQKETRYMIVKKGKAELVDLRKVEQPDVIYLEGRQSISSSSKNRFVDLGFKKLEDKSTMKLLPGGNMGSLSSDVKNVGGISRNVKDIVSAKTFGEQIGVKKGIVNTDDFIGVLDSLDFSQAKIFKMSGMRRGNFGVGKVYERTSLSVRGKKIKLGAESEANNNRLRIGKDYKGRYNPNQIEDMRNRIEYVDKKALTASNIREVTEFESGYLVKLYTWDTGARLFKNVEAYIPKTKTSASVGAGVKVTTASDIISRKKNMGSVGGVGDGVGGGEQVLVNPEVITKEKPTTTFSVTTTEKPKGKSKQEGTIKKPMFKTASSGDDGGPKFYVGTEPGFERAGNVYYPGGSGVRVVPKSRLIGGFFSSNGGGTRVGSRNDVGIGVDSGGKLDVGSSSIVGPVSGVTPISIVSPRVDSVSEQVSLQRSLQQSRFKLSQDRVKDDPFRPKRFKFDLDFEKDNRNVFGVGVKRFGKFKEVARGVGLSKAVQIGSGRVRGSAAASFQVTKFGKPISVSAPSGFYKKGTTLIEQNEFRINQPGELKEITYAGIRTLKR